MTETILITGVSGQDGSLLAKKYIEKGAKVIGTFRRGTEPKLWRIEEMGISEDMEYAALDLSDAYSFLNILDKYSPSKIFHLAGDSFVADSHNHPKSTLNTNTEQILNIFECLRYRNSKVWCFMASSSEIYAGTKKKIINENDQTSPMSPYGLSKLVSLNLAEIYKTVHKLNLSTGILFNHESRFRARSFVTRKITYNLARIKYEGGKPMLIGNLNTERDWSSAEDFIEAMVNLSEKNCIGKYIFSSAKLTPLREFIELACNSLGFDAVFQGTGLEEVCIDRKTGKELCKISEKYYRIADTIGMRGDYSKLKENSIFVAVFRVSWTPAH